MLKNGLTIQLNMVWAIYYQMDPPVSILMTQLRL